MTPSPNCIKNKAGILIWFLQRFGFARYLLFFPLYIWTLQRWVVVCGLGHGRKAFFCAACLFYYNVFTWLDTPSGLMVVMSQRAPNCTIKGSDKQIEPASFLPLLFGYMQNNCSICVNCFFLLFLFPLEVTARIFASSKACVGAWRFEAGANVRFAPWCNNSGEKQCREECGELNLSRGSAAVASFGESPCDARAGMREGVCEGR